MIFFENETATLLINISEEKKEYFYEGLVQSLKRNLNHIDLDTSNTTIKDSKLCFGQIYFKLSNADKLIFENTINNYYNDFSKLPKIEDLD